MDSRTGPQKASQQLRRNVRMFYAWIGSMVMLGAGPIFGNWLLERGTFGARLAAVVLGVGCMLPWLWVLGSIIRGSDEFLRRMHLVALAFAFFASLMLLVVIDWLARAEFISSPPLIFIWAAFLLIWWICLMGAKRYFERNP